MPLPPLKDADFEDEPVGDHHHVLPPILDSSEEEQVVVHEEPHGNRPAKRRLRNIQPLALEAALLSEHRVRLRKVVQAKCKCEDAGCRKPWAGPDQQHAFDQLLDKRVQLHGLPKLEADKALYDMISRQPKRSRTDCLILQEHEVCQRAFALLLGIGTNRFQRLRSAAIEGDGCPDDGRFVPRAHRILPKDSARPLCVEFLQKLYASVAEPMPESKGPSDSAPAGLQLKQSQCDRVKRRGKRPRHLFKQTETEGFHPQAKFLPPGTITEYLELCRSEYPDVRISRRVFTRDPWQCIHYRVAVEFVSTNPFFWQKNRNVFL